MTARPIDGCVPAQLLGQRLLGLMTVALLASVSIANVVRAQTQSGDSSLQRGTARALRPGALGRGALGEGRLDRRANPNRQQALQKQVRQAFARVVQRQLNLNDDQMQRLQHTDQKFNQQRVAVQRQERDARVGLKAALADSTNVDQSKIARYLDQLVEVQHRRADLLEAEQKELAGFLNPEQRAKYLALQQQLQRRIQQVLRPPPARGRADGGIPPAPLDR